MAKSEGTFNASRPAWAQALDRNKNTATLPPPADDEITVERYQQWLSEMGEPSVNEQLARSRLERMCERGEAVMVGLRKSISTRRPTNAYKFVEDLNDAKAKQSLPQEKSKNSRNDKR